MFHLLKGSINGASIIRYHKNKGYNLKLLLNFVMLRFDAKMHCIVYGIMIQLNPFIPCISQLRWQTLHDNVIYYLHEIMIS